jgi:peptidoglycan-N-acetylglucosamine deacetylase
MYTKLSNVRYIHGFLRYVVVFLLMCMVFVMQSNTYSYAKTDDQRHAQSTDTSVYQQLQSGKKIMQEQSYITPDKPTVYLTFDDGPSKLTPQVLDILKKENIQATFFITGDQLNGQAREDILKRIVEEGHTIGNHSYNHEYKQLYSNGFNGFWEQIQQNEDRIEQITGIRTNLIRAPGGTGMNFDAFYFYYLDQAGYLVYDWDVDSGDSRRRGVPASEIIAAVKKSPLKHELNVLMHDGAGHGESVKALPEIIRYYQEEGYVFAPLTEKVKPAQFKVSSKLKWNRQTSADQFAQRLKQSHMYAASQHYQGDQSSLIAALNEVSQQLDLQSNKWNSNKVPLRALAEGIGATVTWNEKEQSVLIRLGKTSIKFTDSEFQAEIFRSGQRVGMYDIKDIEQIDNRYYVSVNSMMQLFAYAVDNTNQHYFPGKDEQMSSLIIRTLNKW